MVGLFPVLGLLLLLQHAPALRFCHVAPFKIVARLQKVFREHLMAVLCAVSGLYKCPSEQCYICFCRSPWTFPVHFLASGSKPSNEQGWSLSVGISTSPVLGPVVTAFSCFTQAGRQRTSSSRASGHFSHLCSVDGADVSASGFPESAVLALSPCIASRQGLLFSRERQTPFHRTYNTSKPGATVSPSPG